MTSNIVTTVESVVPAHIIDIGTIETPKITENSMQCCLPLTIIILFSICLVPFIVCDLYYAYTDDSCVNQQAGNLVINLHDYLAVSGIVFGIIYVGSIILISQMKIIFNDATTLDVMPWLIVVTYIMAIFILSWTITGAVMFWGLIDNHDCNKGVYNYLFASLIIKLASVVIRQQNTKSANKNR